MLILIPPASSLRESAVTPESVYLSRRNLMAAAGGCAAMAALPGAAQAEAARYADVESAQAPPLFWLYQGWTLDLGADPGKALVDRLGVGALTFLLITLGMTPLQRITGWGGWIAVRRQLGLWCFAYAVLQLSSYTLFLLGLDGAQLLIDLRKRPYIIVGALAFVGLLALAATSNRFSIRALGKRWKTLHRLVYPILGLVLLHMLWVVRADLGEWSGYAATGMLLLALRVPFIAVRLPRLLSGYLPGMTKRFQ